MPMQLIRVNSGNRRAAMVLAAKWWHAACRGFGGHGEAGEGEARGMGLGAVVFLCLAQFASSTRQLINVKPAAPQWGIIFP